MRCGGTSRADCDADWDNASVVFVCGSSSGCASEWVLPSSNSALIGEACSLAGWAACSLVFFLLRCLDGRSSWKAAFVCVRALGEACSLAGWTACSLVFVLLRRLDGRFSWEAAFVCLRPPLLLFETLLCPFSPLSDELIKMIEMLLKISAVAPSRADVLMSSCSLLGIAATNTVRVRYNDK